MTEPQLSLDISFAMPQRGFRVTDSLSRQHCKMLIVFSDAVTDRLTPLERNASSIDIPRESAPFRNAARLCQ